MHAGGERQAMTLELAAPLALGQRGLVIGQPRTGATSVLRWLASALIAARVDVRILLVDCPVEEHLEWREEFASATVTGSTSDVEGPEDHLRLTSIFTKASDDAAKGQHVAIVVDSFGALARALAATHDHSDGKVLDGGIPQSALVKLRHWFSLARAGEDLADGSLTVIGAVSASSAQKIDEVILHELVGTGNVEWRLEERIMQASLFPPVDIISSGARKTELILGERETVRRAKLRAEIDRHGSVAGLGLLVERLDDLGSLAAVLDSLDQGS